MSGKIHQRHRGGHDAASTMVPGHERHHAPPSNVVPLPARAAVAAAVRRRNAPQRRPQPVFFAAFVVAPGLRLTGRAVVARENHERALGEGFAQGVGGDVLLQ